MTSSFRYKTLLLFLAMVAGGMSADAAEIQFKEQAEVRGSLVLLGDIADIRGADTKDLEQLRRIELFPAPARSRSRTWKLVELRQLLRLHGVEASEHQYSGADTVMIQHSQEPQKKPAVSKAAAAETAPFVVAKRAIAAGDILRAVDVETKVLDQKGTAGAATSMDAVIGFESLRAVAAGDPIDPRSLRRPTLVRRGDPVVVVAKAAGVRVRTTAKALAEGALGDLVQLEKTDDRQRLSAVVTGLREAEVFASGSTVSDIPASTPSQGGKR